MLAAVLKELEKPLAVEEVPTPEPSRGEVQVEVKASGLCSSDLHYISGASPVGKLPIIPGHEVAGRVSRLGPGVSRVRENDPVAVHYLVTCGRCVYCRAGKENFCSSGQMLGKTIDGGFARYLVVPEKNLVPVPEGVPLEHASLATDAIVTPYHATRLAKVGPGDTVLVAGIGGLGAHAVQLPKLFGADVVIAVDVSPAKLRLAEELNVDYTIDASREDLPARVRQITGGRGVDAVIELTGLKKSIETLARCLAVGGRMVIVGICPEKIELHPYRDILLKESVITGNCDHLGSEVSEVLALLKQGKLDLRRSVSSRIGLADINEGLRMLREGEGNPVRIVVTGMT